MWYDKATTIKEAYYAFNCLQDLQYMSISSQWAAVPFLYKVQLLNGVSNSPGFRMWLYKTKRISHHIDEWKHVVAESTPKLAEFNKKLRISILGSTSLAEKRLISPFTLQFLSRQEIKLSFWNTIFLLNQMLRVSYQYEWNN